MLNRYLRMEEGYFYQVAEPSTPIFLKGKILSYNPLCLGGKKVCIRTCLLNALLKFQLISNNFPRYK